MAFLENLGKKVGEAAQAAAKKSSELVEVTKINMNISTEEEKIQKLYVQMGKKIYEGFSTNGTASEELLESCNAIKTHEDNIAALKEKILEIKNVRACSGCGAELEKQTVFCPKCGARQEVEQPPVEAAAPAPSCPSCGSPVQDGSAFCTKCGTKLV